MSKQVDVLAAYDERIASTPRLCRTEHVRERLLAERSVIAELIAANDEFDSAMAAVAAEKSAKHFRTRWLPEASPPMVRLRAAESRRAEAIARCKGGAA